MSHVYSNEFYDYIDKGARSSAQAMISVVQPWLNCRSVLDLGSGRGVWLSGWQQAGVTELAGVDGDYVDRSRLAIDPTQFHAADLTQSFNLGQRFDLAQSLEVGNTCPLKPRPRWSTASQLMPTGCCFQQQSPDRAANSTSTNNRCPIGRICSQNAATAPLIASARV